MYSHYLSLPILLDFVLMIEQLLTRTDARGRTVQRAARDGGIVVPEAIAHLLGT